MQEAARKIPGECKVCGEPLSHWEMDRWLDLCESTGTDPMTAARSAQPGILCSRCFLRYLADEAEDGNERARAMWDRIVSRQRRENLGMKVVR